jgi:putative phosphoribosyl transferase
MQFKNRKHAGELLAEKLANNSWDKKNTIVIALPRGGVPVAHEIAKKLQLPLDIILVKKIGAPSYPELAVGTVSEDGEEFYNKNLLIELGYKYSDFDSIKEQAFIKLQNIGNALRQGHSPLTLTNKDIILVDDGIATGSTMESVIKILHQRKVKNIFIAAPVASAESVLKLVKQVKRIFVLATPDPIYSIGEWYENFLHVETDEVIKILQKHSPTKGKTSPLKEFQEASDVPDL